VTKKDGDQCGKVAMEGSGSAGRTEAAAPQAKAAARRRLDEAADRMARELHKIATTSESESVKLTAVRDALDRAGPKPRNSDVRCTGPLRDHRPVGRTTRRV
jgi:hypothetical protein